MARRNKLQTQSEDAVLSCDGRLLKAMVMAGMAYLERNYHTVNALNVFPVPDGDTGTNMLLTMRNAFKEVKDYDETHVGRMASKIYNGALLGARGNSGVILSQILLGLSVSLKDTESFDANLFVKSMRIASQTADSVRGMKPVEGTILTVARDGATAAESALTASQDLRVIFGRMVDEMRASVDRTPDLLVKDGEYILKKAGVVDAGGMGLAFIIEGMLRCLSGESFAQVVDDALTMSAAQGEISLSGLDFPYDVQFLLVGESLDVDAITHRIESMGDSALVAGDANLVKVHVHVTNPGVPLGYASELGKITDVVVENMQLQYEGFFAQTERATAAAEPPKIETGSIAVVTVAPSDRFASIFYSIGAGRVVSGGQTMNPSTEDFVTALRSLPTDKAIVLPNNGNVVMAAEQAAKLIDDKTVVVVPSTTIPQGISALLTLDPFGDLSVVADGMRAACHSVQTGEVTTATRNVTLNGVKVKSGQIIGLHNDVLKVAGHDVLGVVQGLLTAMSAEKLELITLYYGETVKRNEAEALVSSLRESYPDHEFELQDGAQPHYFYIISAE